MTAVVLDSVAAKVGAAEAADLLSVLLAHLQQHLVGSRLAKDLQL